MTSAQKVDIDTATLAELQELPGVGRTIAGGIIDVRNTVAKMNLELLRSVPRLRLSTALLKHITFSKGALEEGDQETIDFLLQMEDGGKESGGGGKCGSIGGDRGQKG